MCVSKICIKEFFHPSITSKVFLNNVTCCNFVAFLVVSIKKMQKKLFAIQHQKSMPASTSFWRIPGFVFTKVFDMWKYFCSRRLILFLWPFRFFLLLNFCVTIWSSQVEFNWKKRNFLKSFNIYEENVNLVCKGKCIASGAPRKLHFFFRFIISQ